MKYSGWDYIDHMVDTCKELSECMEGIHTEEDFINSVLVRRAAVMCLLDLGELFSGLGDDEKNLFVSDHWHRIIGFRNRSAHGYHTMDFRLVYSIVVNRVPPIYEFLKQQQARLRETSN